MGLVINYVSKYISVITSDTRVTLQSDNHKIYIDDFKNLIVLPHSSFGWVSGAGDGIFLDVFKLALSKANITD